MNHSNLRFEICQWFMVLLRVYWLDLLSLHEPAPLPSAHLRFPIER